nr:transposase [Virgisporangium aurantiacum]
MLADVGPVQITVPRDRDGSFKPQIVRKPQRRPDRRTQHPRRPDHPRRPERPPVAPVAQLRCTWPALRCRLPRAWQATSLTGALPP